MRFEPGLIPMLFPASKDFGDDVFDCRKGFIAVEVGLGYYQCTSDDGDVFYRISHILSGYCMPGEFKDEQQAQSMIIALAAIGIDWWLSQKALQALSVWKDIRVTYDDIVKRVCPEAAEPASTTDAEASA